jgi:hypothetical protein
MENSLYAGWYPIELLTWIQNQDPITLVGYGIEIAKIAGKLIRIQTFPLSP